MSMAGGIFLLFIVASQMVRAGGTPAGTPITNQASVVYNAGSDTRYDSSNVVTLYVAHEVVINWSPASSPNRTASSVDNVVRYYDFTVTNSGNRADNFNLTTANIAGTPSGTWTVEIVQTGNDNAVTSTGTLAADATFSGRLKVTIPANQTDGTVVTPTLTATSTATNDAGNNIVVANAGQTSTFTVQITIARPVITFSGAQSPASPTNAQRIPGQNFTYTMTVQNTGTAGVTGTSTVTSVLDPNFRYVSSTGSGVISGQDGNGNGGTVTWTIPAASLGAGSSALTREVVVQVQQVTSNATGAASGTSMTAMTTGSSTQTQIEYSDGSTTYNQDNSNSFAFTVGSASGTTLTQVTANGSGNPGSVVEYIYTLKNTGNHSDGYDLSQAQNGGDLNVAHTFAELSLGTSITSITGIAQGATDTIYVRVTIPANAADGNTIIRTLTATTQTATPTSPTGGATYSSDDVTTTSTAPQISVTLAGGTTDIQSQPAGFTNNANAIPGTVMRYTVTITNTGSGVATNVSASNVNAHLVSNSIVANSVDVDADGDGTFEATGLGNGGSFSGGTVTINTTTGIITLTYSSIGSSEYRKYRYNVQVQ
jgi:uncharacterized repeat protein (TIGR01451 family)